MLHLALRALKTTARSHLGAERLQTGRIWVLIVPLRRSPSFLKDFSKTSSIDIWAIPSMNGFMESQTAQARTSGATGYLTVAEVALILGVAKSFVYRRTSPHHPDPMPCYRFGGHLRFLAEEIQEWASRHRKDQEASAVPASGRVVALEKRAGGRVRLRVREPRS